MERIRITKVNLDQLDQLQKIGKATFTETFSAANTEENMKEYLDSGFSATKLKADLTDKNSQIYFALLENSVIGYLKINFGPPQTEIMNEKTMEIERIYVLKEFYGKKVGQVLYIKAIEIAQQREVEYVWLGVWEENQRAIQFYRKNGFIEFDKHIFKLGNDEQIDIMMKLPLR